MALRKSISISPRELDALGRVAYAESRTINDPRKYTSVVDAINNREAAGGWFGQETEGVVNKPKQFTPINGLGTWSNLQKAPQNVQTEITRHLSEQAFGAPQSVPGAPTHYLNRSVPETAYAQSTWAEASPGWSMVGQGPVAHSFGAPDGAPPGFDLSLDPETQMGFGQETYSAASPLSGGIPGPKFDAFGPQAMSAAAPGFGSLSPASVAGLGPNPSAFDPAYSTPSSVQQIAASPVPSAPASPLQPNIDKAKEMLAGLSPVSVAEAAPAAPMGPPSSASFGAPPSATQAEISAAKAALTAGLSGPQTVSTVSTPGLSDAQLGMGPEASPSSFGALSPSMAMPGPSPLGNFSTMPGAVSPVSAQMQSPTVNSPAAQASPSAFGPQAMTGLAPMSSVATMPGAMSPLTSNMTGPAPTVSAPQETQAPAAPSFGAPPAMSAPAMAPAPQVTVAAPQTQQQVNPQQAEQQATPDISITAGAHSAGDFARAMAQQVSAKNAAVNSAGPESPTGLSGALGKMGDAIGGMFGGGNRSTGTGSAGAGGSTGGSTGGSKGGSTGGAKSGNRDSSKGSSGRSTGSRNKAR